VAGQLMGQMEDRLGGQSGLLHGLPQRGARRPCKEGAVGEGADARKIDGSGAARESPGLPIGEITGHHVLKDRGEGLELTHPARARAQQFDDAGTGAPFLSEGSPDGAHLRPG